MNLASLKRMGLLAGNQGHFDLQVNMAIMYFYGEGIPIDYSSAEDWYHKSALQNNAEAQFYMGLYYEEGITGKNVIEKPLIGFF